MLRRFVLIVGLLGAASPAQAGEAGRIVFVTGDVHIAGQRIALGHAVQEGDELATGAEGYTYLKTVDNGFLILRPNTRARITAYRVDRQNPAQSRVKLELLNGVARSISGQAVNQARHNFRFNTPIAAIGVRGTDFIVFTDQETSRVVVVSGGVVVSGFAGACGPEGSGPCEGDTSRELFAGQVGQLLQVSRGQAVPQLLPSKGISPDLTAPPRSDEPAAKRSGIGNATLAANEVSLDPQKSSDLLLNSRLSPVAVPESPPEVLWGRWEAIASLAPDSEALAKLRSGAYVPANILGSFFISRVNLSELVLPREGRASFGLVNSEAYIRALGQAPVAAVIQNSRLDVDFVSRAFSTSLNVVAPGARVDIRAQGDVTFKGELVGDIIRSNASVSGYLGGARAQEAGYLFKSTGTPELSAFGATRWAR